MREFTATDSGIPVVAEVGESPVWDPAGELLWVDIQRGLVHRWRAANRQVETIAIEPPVGSIVMSASGGIAAAAKSSVMLVRRDGSRRVLAELRDCPPNMRLNDGHCDPAGRLWVGTMDTTGALQQASLYRLDPDLSIHEVLSTVSCSNGIGWSPDGSLMYFVDSPTRRIDVFDFDLATGSVSRRRVFTDLANEVGVPDGLCVDASGSVWVAIWGGGQLMRYLPDGALDAVVHVPVRNPTSCTFGGPDLRTLFITTASIRSDQTDLARGAGRVFQCETGIAGSPQHVYEGA